MFFKRKQSGGRRFARVLAMVVAILGLAAAMVRPAGAQTDAGIKTIAIGSTKN